MRKRREAVRNPGPSVATRLQHESPRRPWRGTEQQKERGDGVEQQKPKGILQFERKNPWVRSIEKAVGRNRHR